MSCLRVLVVLDHSVAVESPCWMIFQQVFVCFVALVISLCMDRTLGNLGTSSTCRTILSSLSCKPVLATWYGPSSFFGGVHPSWPLEVTGISGFFKLVHYRSFVAVISSNPYALCAGRNTVLSISRLEWNSLLKSS